MIDPRLGPEFSLLLQCCEWNFADAENDPRPNVTKALDWSRFLLLAERHRVQGLIWNALPKHCNPAPDYIKEALSSHARSIAATNLAIGGECREIQRLFYGAELPLLFVKGLALGALAYRSPMLKMGWDIDLLIDPADLETAASLLLQQGYMLRLPAHSTDLQSWHGQSKESVWHRDDSFYVELHTRLADNLLLIPSIDVHSPRRTVEVSPAVSLPTLAEAELFAYLAVHGASSAWFRLKWISDFAALIHGRTAEEIERLYRRSQELGAARAAGQALLLADRLFDVLAHVPSLRQELAKDRGTRLLCRAALGLMTKGIREPTERPMGTLAIHWTQFLLKRGLSFKVSELRRQAEALLNR